MPSKPTWYPNQLVHVEHPEPMRHSHFGEVMSYETPEHTVMVRRVPGMAATLEEVPVSILRAEQSRRRKWWLHYAIVKGPDVPGKARFSSQFPVAVLHYDGASPVNFTLSREGEPGWERIITTKDKDWPGDELVIARLCDNKTRGHPAFCIERWRSFMWSCKPLRVDPFVRNDLPVKLS